MQHSNSNETPLALSQQAGNDLPVWQKPTFTVLDIENGTQTNTGFSADGNGSSS
jgi:hypothetical protein